MRLRGRRVLVKEDLEGRPIKGCPNLSIGIKPCRQTLAVKTGCSDLVRIEGRPVCLESVGGLTDGTPPGVVPYLVRGGESREAGQDLVAEVP